MYILLDRYGNSIAPDDPMIREETILKGAPVAEPEANSNNGRLWNINFLLLWQGQFVSALGDVAYTISLGFWVLATTGSTALMGSIMAATLIPRVVIAPFAGVYVDRHSRKRLLIITDIIRGVMIVLIGIAALTDHLEIWMLFIAAIAIGIGTAVFNPAVNSVLPDIVSPKKLVKANSVFSLIQTGSGILGNSVAGFLYKMIGAPLLWLFNGITYLVSAVANVFIKVPPHTPHLERPHFFADMKEGLVYVWKIEGLRMLILGASALNFFANMGIMLILPLFEQYKQLGPGLYGLVMAFFTGGLFSGFLFASVVTVKPEQRFNIVAGCSILTSLSLIIFPIFINFYIMAVCAFIGGFVNAVLNAFILAVFQMTTPRNKRGKVFGLVTSTASALTPLAYAIGGVLAEFIAIRTLISGSFAVNILLFIPILRSKRFKNFINYDPDNQKPDELT